MIERLWRFIKEKVLSNKYYPTAADFRNAFKEFFANFGGWKAELDSLLTPKFQFIGTAMNALMVTCTRPDPLLSSRVAPLRIQPCAGRAL
jgi:hypothetical protein